MNWMKSEESGSSDFLSGGVRLKNECEVCIRCLEFQDEITKCNDKWARLELDIRNKKFAIERLEYEVRVLKQRNEELERNMRNGTEGEEDDDRFTQLMIENKVLECEKNKAESETEVWKAKCKELEIRVMELEKRMPVGMTETGSKLAETDAVKTAQNENKTTENVDVSGTPPFTTPFKNCTVAEGVKGGQKCQLKSRARKFLDFAGEGSPDKNISPLTPGVRPPVDPICISDSDDEVSTGHPPLSLDLDSKGIALGEKPLSPKDRFAKGPQQWSDEEETACDTGKLPHLSTPKRRRVGRGVSYVVASESDSDADDNIPICEFMGKKALKQNSDSHMNRNSVDDLGTRNNLKEHTPRRRLVKVRNCENKGGSGKCSTRSTGKKERISPTMNETVDEDEIEESDSGSEGESLGGFIVSSSDVSESSLASICDDISEDDGTFSGDSEESVAYDDIMSGLRRERKERKKWDFEADMLADFGKSAELCMKAVCALYRQQTSEEKSCKAAINLNGRGFSQIHALRGSELAEFLTDGDPHSDLKKSAVELQEFNRNGVEMCRKLATHYSKQLFEIYENDEDPFLHP